MRPASPVASLPPKCGRRLFAHTCAFVRLDRSGRSGACLSPSTGEPLESGPLITSGRTHLQGPTGAAGATAATVGVVRVSAARRVTTRGRRGTILSAGQPVDLRATSSSGRAPQWHCGGAGFESPVVHHPSSVLVQCAADRSTLDAGPTSFKPNWGRVGAGDHCRRHALHGVHLVGCRRAPGLAEHALPALLATGEIASPR